MVGIQHKDGRDQKLNDVRDPAKDGRDPAKDGRDPAKDGRDLDNFF